MCEHPDESCRSTASQSSGDGLIEVRRLASALELSSGLREQACQLFQTAHKKNLIQGRSTAAVAAASVYGACRCNGQSQLLDEVSEVSPVPKSRVTKAYNALNEALKLPAKPISLSQFVSRLAKDLKCPDAVQQRAQMLAEQAEKRGVTTGVHPAGFAAACLYKAGREEGHWLRQYEVADAANISTATVRAHRNTIEGQVTPSSH